MFTRAHQKGDAASEAVYSDCETFRYALTRVWAPGPRLLFVLLNPSTATEQQNDPTIERCERRARAMGFGSFRVANLFALRATNPAALRTVADPVGPDNDAALTESAHWADSILCGWGTHGAHLQRSITVQQHLRDSHRPMFHLGLTKHGQPKHPLYIAYQQGFEPWEPNRSLRRAQMSKQASGRAQVNRRKVNAGPVAQVCHRDAIQHQNRRSIAIQQA